MSRIIDADRSVVVAADVTSERLPGLVIETATVEGLGGYKVGIRALSVGLTRTVDTVREHSDLPIIYDHQKAGNDIPDMGPQFIEECQVAGVNAVILFPFAGPKTQRNWTRAAQEAGLGVIVGGHMTHEEFIASKGGYIADDAPERIYTLAAEMKVRNFVVPGNQPELVEYYRRVIEDVLGSDDYDLFAPGFVTQGGDISETGKVAGKRWHPIVGSGIYGATRKATERATANLFTKIEETPKPAVETLTPEQRQLAEAIYDAGAVQFGKFTLKNGSISPIYFDLRTLQGFPEEGGPKEIATKAYVQMLQSLQFDLIGPIPIAATPLGSSVSDALGVPMVTPRIEKKDHGTGAKVDGMRPDYVGKSVVALDDLITSAGSKIEAIGLFEAEGLVVKDVVVLLDREQGGREELEQQGIRLHAELTMTQLLERLYYTVDISNDQYDTAMEYLATQKLPPQK